LFKIVIIIFDEILVIPAFSIYLPLGFLQNRMKKSLFILTVLFLSLFAGQLHAQLTVPNYTACPNQIVTVTATWPGVQVTGLTLVVPGSGTGAQPGTNMTFTVSASNLANFQLIGQGNALSGPVTNTANFSVIVYTPAPLGIINPTVYCFGQTATLTADLGGNYYTVTASPIPVTHPQGGFPNVITFGPLTAAHTGTYQITSVGACTITGITSISVAPNSQISVNSTSNVCSGTNVNLTATLATGSDYQWYDNYGSAFPAGPNKILSSVTGTNTGSYSVCANINYLGKQCPVCTTTTVNVVQTTPVNVSASPSPTLCQGGALNLNANAGNNVSSINWTGPNNFGPVTGPSQTISNISTVASGNYTVKAFFFGYGITCTETNVIAVGVVPVTIPSVRFPNLNGNTSQCEGKQVDMEATPTNLQFSWIGPAFGSTSPTGSLQSIPVAQPSMSGVYYVTSKITVGTTTCSATNSLQLNIVPVRTISVIPPTPVCQPNNAYLQASAPGAINYSWTGPGGFNQPGSNATVYYPTPAASGVYTVVAYFSGGNLVCTSSTTASLSVYPVLQFTLIPRQQVCYNTALKVTGPSGATSYSWTSSTGFSSNTKDLNFTSVQPKNSGTYTLNISLGPCITTNTTLIEVLNPITFTLSPQSRSVCANDTVPVEVGVTGGSENYAYVWNPPVYLQDPTLPRQVAIPKGTVIYNVTAHDLACPNYTVSHSFQMFVKQPPEPKLELVRTSNPNLSPMEDCVPFCAVWSANMDSTAFNITFDIGGVEQWQGDAVYKCINVPGTHTIGMVTKGMNGCTGYFEYAYPIIVNPKPGSDISWTPERPTTVDEITFNPTAQNGPIIYQSWDFQGGIPTMIDTAWQKTQRSLDTSNQVHPVRKYETYGTYPVMLISTNEKGCIDTVVKFMTVIDDLSVFIPNSFTPNGDGVNDYFMPKGVGIKQEGYTFEILDRWGRPIFFTREPTAGWDGTSSGEKAKDGIYIYKIKIVGLNGEGKKEYTGYFTLYK
jgi:gliding motility-associated-like protein